MPVYTTRDRVTRGVPFGGIGAGKMEITPQGLFNAFTFQNNWSEPLTGTPEYAGILGFHLGFRTNEKQFLLQTVPVLQIPTVQHIRYEGSFPSATIHYHEPRLGLELSLEIFSPWIIGDAKHSSLPAVFFDLRIRNVTRHPADVGFLFIGRNICGEWCVGRRNRIFLEKRSVAVEFSNGACSRYDLRSGTLRFSFLRQGWHWSYMESWNAVTKNFSFTPQDISLLAWEDFARTGILPNTQPGVVAQGENQELCAAVASKGLLPPGGEKKLSFSACWQFPAHPVGHRYQRWFKDTRKIAHYAESRRARLKAKIKTLQKSVRAFPFPDWFNDALLTNLAPFFASSWYARDGRFSFYEAPAVCPLMGTVDVGFYGSIPLSYFFPELEKSLIGQFAKAQRKDGYIPHDLGKNRLDLPSNGTTFYFWKDLNPKFILMVYRDYRWSGDKHFLRSMYPHVKKALDWTLRTDRDGNGLPDNEGEDQTFDLWEQRGTHAYTSGIFLAALLACQKMAAQMKDMEFLEECRVYYLKGRRSFDRELWNGEYFGDACTLSQLNGQWYADLLDLGWIADKEKVQKSLRNILRRNKKHSSFGLINSTAPEGWPDLSNNHSKNIWLGMNYAFISLCIFQGLPLSDLLKEAYKIWDNVTNRQKSPWSMPDMVDAQTGRYLFGDYYYRNMAIWAIPIAYAKKNRKTAAILSALRSIGTDRPCA